MFETLNSANASLNTTGTHICITQLTRPFEHGEGPHWDERKKTLYFVDSYAGRLHSLDGVTGELHTVQFQGVVTAVFTVKDDTKLFIVANNKSLLSVKWSGKTEDGNQQVLLATVEIDKPTNRFNDGKVDRSGRLWIGTMAGEVRPGVVKANQGNVFRVNAGDIIDNKATLNPEIIIPEVTISNGICWNRLNEIMYYIDTSSYKVMAYNFNLHSGTVDLNTATVIFDFTEHKKFVGAPDGMTIDRDDNLWVALYGGGCIVHINPRSKIVIRIVAIPSRYVTSVIFGGLELETLYVTTSRRSLTENERKWQPSAGAIFAVTGIPTGFVGTHTNIINTETIAPFLKDGNDSDDGDLYAGRSMTLICDAKKIL